MIYMISYPQLKVLMIFDYTIMIYQISSCLIPLCYKMTSYDEEHVYQRT